MMKRTNSVKFISFLLVLTVLLSAGTFFGSVGAAETKAPSLTKTEVDDDGTVLCEYSDGSKRAIDSDGNIFELRKDGSSKSYFTDGSYLVTDKDGGETLHLPDGIKTYTDGKGTVSKTDEHGITTRWNEDGSVEMYFEGGTGTLKRDSDGSYTGKSVSPSGVTLEKRKLDEPDEEGYDEVITLTGPDDSFHSEVKTRSAVTDNTQSFASDLVVSTTDGMNMTIGKDGSFKYSDTDGNNYDIDANGYGDIMLSDGSYMKKSANSVDYLDKATGEYLKVDKNAGTFEMKLSDGTTSISMKDGVVQLNDSASGAYLIKKSDGSYEMGNTKTGVKQTKEVEQKYVWVLEKVTYKSFFEFGSIQYKCSADETGATVNSTDTYYGVSEFTAVKMPGKIITGETDSIVSFEYSTTGKYLTISARVSAYDLGNYIINSKGDDAFMGPETSGYVDCTEYFQIDSSSDPGDHMRLIVTMGQGTFTYDYYIHSESEADSVQVTYVTDQFLF